MQACAVKKIQNQKSHEVAECVDQTYGKPDGSLRCFGTRWLFGAYVAHSVCSHGLPTAQDMYNTQCSLDVMHSSHKNPEEMESFQGNFFHLSSFNSSQFLSSIQKVEVSACASPTAGGREQKCLAVIGFRDSYFK